MVTRTLGIFTPWRDMYASAADSLARAVHAHIWPGGEHAFALAQPMDGGAPVLGLRVRAGGLRAYSIESREPRITGSNVRGHVVLHVTDAARAPHAFGGPQPHVRMHDVAIRHWDGYWLGREQLWGDVFPHHWSVLTANVLLLAPPAAAAAVERDRGVPAQRIAAQIYAANLIDFRPDGTATDWALFWPLHLGVA